MKQISIAKGGAKTPSVEISKSSSISVNYEAMTLVELKDLAKQRGIKGCSVMRRSQILEAIRAHESGGSSEPLKLNEGILTALLEQAQSLDQSE